MNESEYWLLWLALQWEDERWNLFVADDVRVQFFSCGGENGNWGNSINGHIRGTWFSMITKFNFFLLKMQSKQKWPWWCKHLNSWRISIFFHLVFRNLIEFWTQIIESSHKTGEHCCKTNIHKNLRKVMVAICLINVMHNKTWNPTRKTILPQGLCRRLHAESA